MSGFVVKERGAPNTARARFLCEPCHAKGAMPEPVELPVMSRRCPLCGKAKGLARIWAGDAPHVATAAGRAQIHATELIGPEYDRQRNAQQTARHQAHHPLAPRIVAASGIGGAIEQATAGGIKAGAIGLPSGVAKRSARPVALGGAPALAGPQPRLAAPPYTGEPS